MTYLLTWRARVVGDVLWQRGNEPLHVASLAGQLTVVRLLVENGAYVNNQAQVSSGVAPVGKYCIGTNDCTTILLASDVLSLEMLEYVKPWLHVKCNYFEITKRTNKQFWYYFSCWNISEEIISELFQRCWTCWIIFLSCSKPVW